MKLETLSFTLQTASHALQFKTSSKGTIGPGRSPLAYILYYVIMISPACA